MQIQADTLSTLLSLGGQYLIPIAALLRALYSGVRGKLPEGFAQIIGAGALAGITAAVSGQSVDLRGIVLTILSNSVFTAGLLSFIVVYLLRMPNWGLLVDAIVGGAIGLIVWLFTVYILGEPWPWWAALLLIPAAAVGFVALRFGLRQIIRLVRLATWLVGIGLVLMVAAGGFWLLRSLTGAG